MVSSLNLADIRHPGYVKETRPLQTCTWELRGPVPEYSALHDQAGCIGQVASTSTHTSKNPGVHSRTFLAIGLLEGQDGDADLPAGPVPSVKAGGKNIFRLLDIGGSDQIDLCKSPVSYSNWHDLLLVSSASHCVTVSVEWCDNKGPLLRKTEQLQEAALKGMLTERSSTALTPSQCCATLFSSRCSKPLSR